MCAIIDNTMFILACITRRATKAFFFFLTCHASLLLIIWNSFSPLCSCSWPWTISACTGSSAGAASEKCTAAGRPTQERCKEKRAHALKKWVGGVKARKGKAMLWLLMYNLCRLNVRYAMKCLDKKRIKMKQGETLALNERIMLSLVSTGVSSTQQQLTV